MMSPEYWPRIRYRLPVDMALVALIRCPKCATYSCPERERGTVKREGLCRAGRVSERDPSTARNRAKSVAELDGVGKGGMGEAPSPRWIQWYSIRVERIPDEVERRRTRWL